MRKKRRNQWNQFTESITAKTSSHKVWEKIRKISGKRKSHQIKRQIKSNGQSITSPLEIANELASQKMDRKAQLNLLGMYEDICSKENFPKESRSATVIPILQPGKIPIIAGSYRPISLTNCLCKVL
jgi:hypothetical protein